MAMATKSYDVGDMIEMRLMRREKGSLQVIPVEQYEQWPKRSLLTVADRVDTAYAKLLEADAHQVTWIRIFLSGSVAVLASVVHAPYF